MHDEAFANKSLAPEVKVHMPDRGHVSMLCASYVIPHVLVADRKRGGVSTQTVSAVHPTWVLSGRGRTSAAGVATVVVNDFLDKNFVSSCVKDLQNFDWYGTAIVDARPVFIASAHSNQPVVLTSRIIAEEMEEQYRLRAIPDGTFYPSSVKEYRLTATVCTWSLDGTPAGTEFSWMCVAEAALEYWDQ